MYGRDGVGPPLDRVTSAMLSYEAGEILSGEARPPRARVSLSAWLNKSVKDAQEREREDAHAKLDLLFLPVAKHANGKVAAGRLSPHRVHRPLQVPRKLTTNAHDHVAHPQARLFGRALFQHVL